MKIMRIKCLSYIRDRFILLNKIPLYVYVYRKIINIDKYSVLILTNRYSNILLIGLCSLTIFNSHNLYFVQRPRTNGKGHLLERETTGVSPSRAQECPGKCEERRPGTSSLSPELTKTNCNLTDSYLIQAPPLLSTYWLKFHNSWPDWLMKTASFSCLLKAFKTIKLRYLKNKEPWKDTVKRKCITYVYLTCCNEFMARNLKNSVFSAFK